MSDPGVLVTPEEVEERTRLVLDYTSRDFAAIRSQLVGLAKGFMPEWTTVGEASDFGTLILELFAYMGDVLHFYVDRTASEAFLGTAIRRQSVLYIVDQFGYVPIGQQAASVKLVFGLAENATAEVTLPKGTRLHNNPENADELVVFELDQPVVLALGDIEVGSDSYVNSDPAIQAEKRKPITASEGVTVNDSALGVSQGQPNTDFILADKGVIFGSIVVRSLEAGRNVVWTYTSDLSLARPTQSQFTTFTDDMEWTHLVFGDNASGRIPPVNAQMFVTYRYGVGSKANDLDPNTITTLVPPANVEVWGVTVTNPGSPLGGTDPETVESMRYSVPRAAARIKSRAVTLNDFSDLALQVPGVAKSIAHGAVYTAVYVRIAPTNGAGDDSYMQKLCASVEAYLADKIMVGSTVYAEPRHFFDLWRDVWIQMTVHVIEGYNRTSVRLSVENAIRTGLAFNSVDFGTDVTIGSMYRAALAVQGVGWVELTHLADQPPPEAVSTSSGSTVPWELSEVWRYDSAVDTSVDPGTGDIRTTAIGSPTGTAALSITTSTGKNVASLLADITVGDQILVRQNNNAALWWSVLVTGPVVNNGTWFQIPFTRLDTSATGSPQNNAQVLVSVFHQEVQDQGMVSDLLSSETDGTHLLIPRIAPLPAIETASVTNVALTSNVATLTTSTEHGMNVGDTIDVAAVTPGVFNGRYVITVVPTVTTLSYAKVNADVASVATTTGTVTTVNLPESEVDYPGMSEAERTHDGLWVIAVGGMVNT